jgi:RHS repeat-associated protein
LLVECCMNLSFDGGVTDDGADVVERRPYDAGACPERSRRGACTVLDADGSDDSDNASDVENSASARSGGTSREPTGRVPQGCNGAAGHNPFLFTGRRLDSEWAGMQYRNRSYSTTLGRFVSRDSARREGCSLYAYVASSPPGRADPLGLREVVVEVIYEIGDAKLLNAMPTVQANVQRIADDCMARFGKCDEEGNPNTLAFRWYDTAKLNYTLEEIRRLGRYGCHENEAGQIDRVTVHMRTHKGIPLGGSGILGIGATSGSTVSAGWDTMEQSKTGCAAELDLAGIVSIVYSHEILFHVLGGKTWHYHDEGYVDAAYGPDSSLEGLSKVWQESVLSEEACQRLVSNLGFFVCPCDRGEAE